MLPLEKEQQNGDFGVHPVLYITVVLGFNIVKLKPNNSQELKLLYSSCIVDSSSSSGSDIFSARRSLAAADLNGMLLYLAGAMLPLSAIFCIGVVQWIATGLIRDPLPHQ